MEKYIKNFPIEEVVVLKEQVQIQEGQVVSKTLVQNKHISFTLFAFDKGEEIGTNDSTWDALVNVLEGTLNFVVYGNVYVLY